MPTPYNPAPDQPLIVFFDITLGSFSKIYIGPEIPIDFTWTQDTVGNMTLTLYDLTGNVEYQIWQALKPGTNVPGGTVQWGYLNGGPKSPVYDFDLVSYHPVMAGNAYILTIIGFSTLSPYISNNAYSGKLMDILNQFVQNHDMQLNVNPPFGVQYMQDVGYTDIDGVIASEKMHCKFNNDTDIAFIERILEWARDSTGRGGYRYYITQDSGNKTLNITLPPTGGTANYKYIFQDKNSACISWSPDIGFIDAVNGANDVQKHSTQRGTGDDHCMIAQQANTKQFQTTHGLPTSPQAKASPPQPDAQKSQYFGNTNNPPEVSGASIRGRVGASSSPVAGFAPFLNDHLQAWMGAMPAKLSVFGDPQIFATDTQGNQALADVTVYWQTNYIQTQPNVVHYTSGLYLIDNVEHRIVPGSYITTLGLTRACANTPNTDGGQ